MSTIRAALEQFLIETGRGNQGSTASPAAIIRLFENYLDGWAHEGLNPFERKRFEDEYTEDQRFSDIFDPSRLQPHDLNAMTGHFADRHGPGTKGFLKAVGPVMEKLASWLVQKGFWTSKDLAWYRELVGDAPGTELPACEAFAQLLFEHIDLHPVNTPDDLPDED